MSIGLDEFRLDGGQREHKALELFDDILKSSGDGFKKRYRSMVRALNHLIGRFPFV